MFFRDEDEEQLLRLELEKIKKQREAEREEQARLEEERKRKKHEQQIKSGNPLMTSQFLDPFVDNSNRPPSFTMKRSWIEDTVFSNQAAEPKRKKRFINDRIRSDFHRKFMDKYVK